MSAARVLGGVCCLSVEKYCFVSSEVSVAWVSKSECCMSVEKCAA